MMRIGLKNRWGQTCKKNHEARGFMVCLVIWASCFLSFDHGQRTEFYNRADQVQF